MALHHGPLGRLRHCPASLVPAVAPRRGLPAAAPIRHRGPDPHGAGRRPGPRQAALDLRRCDALGPRRLYPLRDRHPSRHPDRHRQIPHGHRSQHLAGRAGQPARGRRCFLSPTSRPRILTPSTSYSATCPRSSEPTSTAISSAAATAKPSSMSTARSAGSSSSFRLTSIHQPSSKTESLALWSLPSSNSGPSPIPNPTPRIDAPLGSTRFPRPITRPSPRLRSSRFPGSGLRPTTTQGFPHHQSVNRLRLRRQPDRSSLAYLYGAARGHAWHL